MCKCNAIYAHKNVWSSLYQFSQNSELFNSIMWLSTLDVRTYGTVQYSTVQYNCH